MVKIKKSLSLLLTLLMMLGMVVLSSPASAQGQEEAKEVPYEVKTIDGKDYKVYSFKDLFGASASKKQMKIGALDMSEPRIMGAVRGSGPLLSDPIPNEQDAMRYAVNVDWTTYDLQPPQMGTPIYFQIADFNNGKIIGQTKEVTAKGKAIFYKLPAWNDHDVTHDPNEWELIIPTSFEFDVRLKTGPSGDFAAENVRAIVAQKGMPLYRAEYFTNKTIPTIKAQRRNPGNKTLTVEINETNLGNDEYYSFALPIGTGTRRPTYEGRSIEVKHYGSDTDDTLKVSDAGGAARVKMAMMAPGKTDFDRGPGTFEDNGTPYHYEVTGDYLHPHIFTIRQDLTVNFDANKGAWKSGNAPADQTIGHSMKLGDSWAGLGPIAVPGENDLTPPAAAEGEKEKKFIGWNTDANAKTALFTDNTYAQPITKDETFYAIYAEKEQGIAKVKYNLDGTEKDASQIDAKYKIDSQDYPAELKGNLDEKIVDAVFDKAKAPKFIGYEIASIETDPVPANVQDTANYTKNGDYTVIYKYNKLPVIIPEKNDDGTPNNKVTDDVKATYIPVTIKVDTNKGQFKKAGAAKTEAEFKYYVNPVEGKSLQDVLTASGLSAEAKDANAAQIDKAKPWMFTPAQTEIDAPVAVALSTKIDKENFKNTKAVTMKVNFKQTTADKFKDKLAPETIKVWVKGQIDWKKGVKVKDDAANKDQLVADLKTELAKAKAKVEDLGENGTIAQPAAARTSDAQNLPDGKKGNLKVTFDDGSTLVVNDQMLYVAPVKVKKDDETVEKKLPDTKVQVDIKLGEGTQMTVGTEVKKGDATNPYVWGTFFLKPSTGLAASDFPAVEQQPGYKANSVKWTPAEQTKAWNENGAYVATAEKQTIAEIVGQGNLSPVHFGVWKGESSIDWKKGVKVADSVMEQDIKTAIEGYLNDAKTVVSDNTTPARTSKEAGKFPGKLTVKFSDDSTLTVDKQTLYVWEHKTANTDNNENNPKPADAVQVSFAKGTGVTALDPADKTMTVKPDTTLEEKDFPTATVDAAKGYVTPAIWTGKVASLGHKVTAENNVFTATAEKPFNKNDITDIAFIKDPDKMKYTEGSATDGKMKLAGLKIKLTDGNRVEKTIGANDLADYGVTVAPAEDTDLTKANNDGKHLTATAKVKGVTGALEDKTVNSPGELIVRSKTSPGGSSGGGYVIPSKPEPKPSDGDLNKDDHYQYLVGYPDGTFAPNKGMTRAEVATMFTRLLKDRPVKGQSYAAGLSDIHAGDWYADTVGYAVQKGIVSGYPDGTFKPNQPITRAEFSSIASRFAELTEEKDLTFSDLDASHWGYKAIRLAASNGWISGYPDNTFRPEKAITRAEVTSITNRMLNRYADLDWINAHNDEVIHFSDVSTSDWFFEPIMEATMGHDFTRDADGKTEHWTGLNGKSFI